MRERVLTNPKVAGQPLVSGLVRQMHLVVEVALSVLLGRPDAKLCNAVGIYEHRPAYYTIKLKKHPVLLSYSGPKKNRYSHERRCAGSCWSEGASPLPALSELVIGMSRGSGAASSSGTR